LLILVTICLVLNPASGHCQIIDYNTLITAEPGKLITEKSFLIQVNNRQSDWLSDISISYNQGDKLEILEASVLNAHSVPVRTLSKKEITTRHDISGGSFFEDDWVKEFKLRWNTYPYQVKYRYKITTRRFIQICTWSPLAYFNVPTVNARLKVVYPIDYPVVIDSPNLPHDSVLVGGKKILEWNQTSTPSVSSEPFSPHLWEAAPHVTIVPRQFTYEIPGSLHSWSAFGQWQAQLIAGTDVLPNDEMITVGKLVEGIHSKHEIIRRLYHYLQDNTRYVSVAIDAGGLKPYPASYVSSKKYGDCKGLTIYMKALLATFGISSYYTLVYGDENPKEIRTNFPSQQFNHVILCVPVDRDTVWLENTAGHLPYNYLGTFTQNRKALLVNGTKSQLVTTPKLEPHDVLVRDDFEFTLNIDGDGTGTATKELRGPMFEQYRYLVHSNRKDDIKTLLEKSLSQTGFQLSDFNLTQMDRDSLFLSIHLALHVQGQLRRLGNTFALKPRLSTIPDLDLPKSRKTPVRINYPMNWEHTNVYNLPFLNAYDVTLPANVQLSSRYGSYSTTYQRNGLAIIVTNGFLLKAGEYPPESYADFQSFFHSIKKSTQESSILLNPK